MKWHLTKEQSFDRANLSEEQRAAFYAGWYAAGDQINNGEDSDWLSARLCANDFITTDPEPGDD